jgi:glycosyltransferase involved in cell wall biosynthesis
VTNQSGTDRFLVARLANGPDRPRGEADTALASGIADRDRHMIEAPGSREPAPSIARRRVLMISPHFPPDTSAATHRVRLLAPYLAGVGWDCTILTVDPRDYDGRLDDNLERMVSPGLRIVRTRALSAKWTRRFGIGDLGLRAFRGLLRGASQLLERERFDLLFITIYPSYTALLGPRLKRRFGVPFVLDYQDPWVGEWGKSVGGGEQGTADFKSRLSRRLALILEPRVVAATDAITAVSEGTYESIRRRIPAARRIPCAAIPLGGEPADFEYLRNATTKNTFFERSDGLFHLCYVGTLLPLGIETLRAVLQATRLLRQQQPQLFAKLRIHFFGTSNQTSPEALPTVLPHAQELGLDDCVTEHPSRIDYLDALSVQTDASGLLLMGSSEHHYTASKLYPALLARRPILAVYHEKSSVAAVIGAAVREPSRHLVTYSDDVRAESHSMEITSHLAAMIQAPEQNVPIELSPEIERYSAKSLARELAAVFDSVVR